MDAKYHRRSCQKGFGHLVVRGAGQSGVHIIHGRVPVSEAPHGTLASVASELEVAIAYY